MRVAHLELTVFFRRYSTPEFNSVSTNLTFYHPSLTDEFGFAPLPSLRHISYTNWAPHFLTSLVARATHLSSLSLTSTGASIEDIFAILSTAAAKSLSKLCLTAVNAKHMGMGQQCRSRLHGLFPRDREPRKSSGPRSISGVIRQSSGGGSGQRAPGNVADGRGRGAFRDARPSRVDRGRRVEVGWAGLPRETDC